MNRLEIIGAPRFAEIGQAITRRRRRRKPGRRVRSRHGRGDHLMQARYADGRAAVFQDVACDDRPGRADRARRRGHARMALRDAAAHRRRQRPHRLQRKPDTGERLIFAPEHERALRAAAPRCSAGVRAASNTRLIVGGVIAVAWSLAAAFLIGVPMAAGPIRGDHAGPIPPADRRHLLVPGECRDRLLRR